MKIALCDDNPKDRAVIKKWFAENKPEIKRDSIVEFSSGEDLLRYLNNNTIGIIFLDCQMDGMDGIATAQQLRGNFGDVIIILVSNYTEYAVHGYDLDVFRYIMKADFSEKVSDVVEKALSRLKQSGSEAYWVKSWGKPHKIYIDEIVYIESHRNKVEIRLLNNSTCSQYKKLDAVAEKLIGCGFIRCHQSYLVNSRYVRRMDKTVLELDNGGNIPVSREMYKPAYDKLSLMVSEGI